MKQNSPHWSQPVSITFSSASKARKKKPPTKSPAQSLTRKSSAFLIGCASIASLSLSISSSCATRIEFANVQYYGWAFANRENLLPTREQLDQSLALIKREQERLQGRIRLEYVVPDYYAKYPKPCMGGWGRKLMLITPSGDALPCHAAQVIPGLSF